jgi:pimeloyl-ACP methyl ester carboxylesterase
MQIETGYVSVPGGQLYYETAGDPSRPTLLFIHAGVADCTMWDPQFEYFAPNYRVVRYDTRGYGKTRTEDIAFSNRQDVADLLDHLAIDKVVVVGCSRGGQIAIDFTLDFPQRVLALAPVAAGLSGFPYEPRDDPKAKFVEPMFAEMEAAWEAKDFARLADLDVRLWADGPGQAEGRASAEVRESVRQMCLSNYVNAGPEGKPIPLDPPAFGRMGEINVPTLVVLGDLDTGRVLMMADAMERGIVGAQKVVFFGAAHMPTMEQPEVFNRVLSDFLKIHGL